MNTTSTRTITPPWEPAAVLPSQFGDRRSYAHSPELRLVAAMFEDALRSVLRNADARRGPRRREFAEAREWLLDDSRDWPFAFANVCDLLGLDATAVRQSLRAIITTPHDESRGAIESPPEPQDETRGLNIPPARRGPPSDDQRADRERFEVVGWDEV